MIQVKVHVFNTLLLLKKRKKLSHSVFCDGGTCTPVAGVSPSKISNFSASLKHGLEQVVHLLWWQGHSLRLECFKRRHAHLQEHLLCLKHVSPTRSSCVCWGWSLGTWKARGEFGHCCWRGTVWCGMLHGIWRCHVEIQCRTMFDLQHKTEGKKTCISVCEHYT